MNSSVGNKENCVFEDELKNIFTKDSIIGVKHNRIFNPIITLIYAFKNSKLYLRLTENFLSHNLLYGEEVQLSIFIDSFEYVIEGEINEFCTDEFPPTIGILIKTFSKYPNHRKAKRYHTNFLSQFKKENSNKNFYGIIKNISKVGICAISKEKLFANDLVEIRFDTNINRKNVKENIIQAKGKVVRLSGNLEFYEYGIDFCEFDEINKQKLCMLIDKLDEDEKTVLFI